MKKIIIIVFIYVFTSCSEQDICESNCWEVLQGGNLGITVKNTCDGTIKDYVYTKNKKEKYSIGDVICDLDFN